MRFTGFILLSGFLLFAVPGWGQQSQTAISSTQATTILQRSLQALAPGGLPNDITLSGNIRRIAGSDDETGTAVFKAIASGVGRTDLNLSGGPRSEVSDLSGSTPTGTWSGPDGRSHSMAFQNLVSEAAWFFPTFAIARRLSSAGYVATYVGQETQDGRTVEHITIYKTPPSGSGSDASLFEHLTQVDIFIDSTTLLPTTMAFDIHPDKNAAVDIPVRIRFSDYRLVSGVQVPYHVRRYINNSLILDFQTDTVAVNSGLTASALDTP